MATQEDLWPIYQVQKLDAKIALTERTRAALDDGSALAAGVAERRQVVASLKEDLHRLDTLIRDEELELSSVEAKLKKIEGILYSGKVTNPKELQGYEGELDSLRRRQNALEDEALGRMEEKDALQQRLAAAREAEAEARAGWEAHVSQYRESAAALDGERTALCARREALRAQANADLLRRYDMLARQRKLLVGRIDQDACDACGILLPVRLIKQYKAVPDAEIACPSCAAHLLWRVPDEEAS